MLPPLLAVVAEHIASLSLIVELEDSAVRLALEKDIRSYTRTDDPTVLRERFANDDMLGDAIGTLLLSITTSGSPGTLQRRAEDRTIPVSARAKELSEGPAEEVLRSLKRLSPLEQFNAVRRLAGDAYAKLSFGDRLRVTETSTFISYAGCLAGFAMWWLLLPPIRVADLALISSAFAADGTSATSLDPKLIINVAAFALLFLAFILSRCVSYFSKNEKASESASTTSKSLLAFLKGAGTKFLGV